MATSTPKLYLMTSCEQPKDVWDVLRKHCERETLVNKLFLKRKYFRMEMKEVMSAEAHIKQTKELTRISWCSQFGEGSGGDIGQPTSKLCYASDSLGSPC